MKFSARLAAAAAIALAAASGGALASPTQNASAPIDDKLSVLPEVGPDAALYLAQAKPRKPAPKPVDPTPPDFGTVQGTARIAGTAGFLDVVGIKLGTPEKDAVAILQKHNPELTLTPLRLMTYTAQPNVSRTPVIVATMKPARTPSQHFERLSLELTYSPSGAFVWGVSREYTFAQGKALTFENMVESFRSKYGPESFQFTNEQFIWIFDPQGKLVPGQQGRNVFTKCSSNQWRSNVSGVSAGGNRPTHDNRLSNSFYDQQLRGGYYFSQHGRDFANGVCHSHTSIHLGLQRLSARPGEPVNLVRGFVMRAANHQLEASGIQASHQELAAAADAIMKKREGEAAKRAGPKL